MHRTSPKPYCLNHPNPTPAKIILVLDFSRWCSVLLILQIKTKMATSNALSKCQRRYLFEPCNHFVGRLAGCHVRTAMKNLLFPALCLFRHFAIKVSFPWTQNETGELSLGLSLICMNPSNTQMTLIYRSKRAKQPFDH